MNEPSGWPLGQWWPERAGLTSPVSLMAHRMTRCPEGQRSLLGVGVGMGGKHGAVGAGSLCSRCGQAGCPQGLSLRRVKCVPSLHRHTVVPGVSVSSSPLVIRTQSYGLRPPNELTLPEGPLKGPSLHTAASEVLGVRVQHVDWGTGFSLELSLLHAPPSWKDSGFVRGISLGRAG